MDKLVTGLVRSTHGVEGCLKIESASGEFDHFALLKEVTVRNKRENFEASFKVDYVKKHNRCILLKLIGIDNLTQAKQLLGSELLVPRYKACPLEEGEFYVSDLCQCSIVYDGLTMGKIIGLIEGGSGDLLEVSLSESALIQFAGPKTRLVPFKKEFIGEVNIEQAKIELRHRWILE